MAIRAPDGANKKTKENLEQRAHLKVNSAKRGREGEASWQICKFTTHFGHAAQYPPPPIPYFTYGEFTFEKEILQTVALLNFCVKCNEL